ncbi:hypothetical protein T069G_00240 [Trichoderma breve]|uniref:Heterokaryon incompatibility domain-containing protein n=1 Tax=Trichoderma breve TaxID=2034170 RepID=A0A9W9EBL5_9HYPO|nr:hypothetical protein T069G_00240 [Trichoderma breve]KAJ4863710.1 hypothetical protein T069G_00240 [Trichoderma breve]
MGAVYRNATLTVSALVSAKSTSAKLMVYEDSSRDEEVEVDWKSQEEENLRRLMNESVLTSRGWTLQEYILSPRNLLYGARQIYWRCPNQKFRKASQVIYSDILAVAPEIESDIRAVLEDYYELAETYSARQLTYGSDKHAAFSGIAQMIHPSIGGQYLAGLWTVDFKHGLLWYAEMASCRHVESHGAPSWSWMTTPFDVKILQYNGISQDAVKQFGQVESASVVVEGLTMPLIRSKQHVRARDRDDLVLGSVYYDEPSSGDDDDMRNSIFTVDDQVLGQALISLHADPGTDDVDISSNLFLEDDLLVLLVQADENVDNEMESSFGEGIVLRPVKHGLEDVYERAGYVTFWMPSMDYFRGWALRSLKMI